MENATINIRNKERQGLTFIAISQVKGLDGLRIQPPFTYERYEKMAKGAAMQSRKKRLKLIT